MQNESQTVAIRQSRVLVRWNPAQSKSKNLSPVCSRCQLVPRLQEELEPQDNELLHIDVLLEHKRIIGPCS